MPEDRREHACRAAPGDRARCARGASSQTRFAARVPRPAGGYLDLHNFRNREWKPAQRELGIAPIRRVYDLRHSFAFALRAGVSTFDLSRCMGASLTMIDRHYGHLAKDGRQHAINLLDTFTAAAPSTSTSVDVVDVRWTQNERHASDPSPANTL